MLPWNKSAQGCEAAQWVWKALRRKVRLMRNCPNSAFAKGSNFWVLVWLQLELRVLECTYVCWLAASSKNVTNRALWLFKTDFASLSWQGATFVHRAGIPYWLNGYFALLEVAVVWTHRTGDGRHGWLIGSLWLGWQRWAKRFLLIFEWMFASIGQPSAEFESNLC